MSQKDSIATEGPMYHWMRVYGGRKIHAIDSRETVGNPLSICGKKIWGARPSNGQNYKCQDCEKIANG